MTAEPVGRTANAPAPARTASRPSERLLSLDAFRGATIASMILVNNPGSDEAIYWPLEHAAWNGWTPTDLIFPFFLFMVGISLSFSRRGSLRQAARRAAILFALGLFLNAFPFFDLASWRIPGVLQRIAICYLVVWVLRRAVGLAGQWLLVVVLLFSYWALMTLVPVPGVGAPNLEPVTNLAAYVDSLFLTGHMWSHTRTWDPEGLLSTLPSFATTLLGALAGAWLRSERTENARVAGFVGAGLVLTVLGLAWGESFPINKGLWTSSFVLLTAGLASALFGLFYLIADVWGYRRWARPFVVFGVNAIFVYVASGLLARTLGLVELGGASLQERIYEGLARWFPPIDASLAFALATVGFWYGVLLWLDRRGVRIKV